ncbi:MAG TPA: bifunctional RNase H/acid phosphatase [Mycobacteriales bacterium]|jgi:probable phosphoglycerate mutase|nr:bifunctional RNase H/acid phosphatase [Mycobacteriales bacterium]
MEADGGSRGNPGPAGYGAVVLDAATGAVLAERAATLGVATNNVAEYSGLIAGLEAARELGARQVDVRMDSKLVVEQMSGRWKIKHPDMKPLASRAAGIVRDFDGVSFTWIPREQNKAADALANSAMDGRPVHRDLWGDPEPEPEPEAEVDAGGPTDPWSGTATTNALTTVLVRHGASPLSPQKRFSGRADVPLSPDGRAQAALVARRLADRGGIDLVVTSPLRRAVRTAEAVAAAVGADLVVDTGLVETDFGRWEGLTFAEAWDQWPAELGAWLASPDVAPPGGESFTATAERVQAALDRLRTEHLGRTLAVVSHVTPIKTLLRLALEAPPSALFRMHLDVAGLSEVDWYADGPASVRYVNDTAHLR